MLHHFVGGQILFRHAHGGRGIARAFEFAHIIQLEAAAAHTLQQPLGHQRRGRLFGVRQLGFEPAQGFAQLGQQVFRTGGRGLVHQQEAAARVAHGLRSAAAGEGAGQQVVGDLLFELLLFFAPHSARFGFLDFGDFVVQNLADYAGGQHFFGFFQRHAPSEIGGEHQFRRKSFRRGKAFAKPVQTLRRGKFGRLQLGGQGFQIRQFGFV